MSHYFLCSQNKDSINKRFIQLFISDFVAENFFPKTPSPKPARIPPQTPPAGGKSVEAGRIRNPRQIVSPCRVRISIFNRLDFARNSFELCPTNTAKIENRNRKPKWGRHEVPTQMYSPQKILNLKGFATLRVA
ncbi:MAG: hypothetical protein NTZ44_01445, partial [Candidatus Nomurabacteria bacterium]|nr:hypothetical protein [Candidatus Nomurabacteria bacterium]